MATITISAAKTIFDIHAYNMNAGVHNFTSNTVKVALTNTKPIKTNEILADISQISGGGYTSGGYSLTLTAVTKQEGVSDVIYSDLKITAGSGGTGKFQYAVIYNDTPTSPADPLIAFYDLGAEYSLAQGQVMVVDIDEKLLRVSTQA